MALSRRERASPEYYLLSSVRRLQKIFHLILYYYFSLRPRVSPSAERGRRGEVIIYVLQQRMSYSLVHNDEALFLFSCRPPCVGTGSEG